MKKIVTIAAVAALTTLSACNKAEEAPADVTATEAANSQAGNADAAGGDIRAEGDVQAEPTVSPN